VNKRHRLSRSADFERVYRQGKSVAGRYAILYYFDQPEETAGNGPRLGVSVSRKVGGAVVRNRVKRTVKEIFRQHQEEMAPGYDYVIIARTGLAEYIDKSRFEEVSGMIEGLFRRADLIQEAD